MILANDFNLPILGDKNSKNINEKFGNYLIGRANPEDNQCKVGFINVLDVEGDPLKVGKRLNKDNRAGKATFVSLLGMDTAKKHSSLLIDKAHEALVPYGGKAKNLRQLASFVISRNK